jgi:hypothetical protein
VKRLARLLALALLVALPSVARATSTGSIVIVSTGAYGDPATFSWTLVKKPQVPTLGVECQQGGQWRYIAELSVARTLTGTASVVVVNEMSSALPGSLDPTLTASCYAAVWDELRSARGPVVLTEWAHFTLEATP